MKRIITNGIADLEPLAGSSEWYWGADYASGDLYEAEELFRSGHPIQQNYLPVVIHRPAKILPLSSVEDCYNLRLEAPPLMLTRSAHDNKFQILWPERRDFAIEDHEFFEFLEENRLYTTVWYEDPNYREEVLVRDYETGEVLERIPGSLRQMPDGQRWLLV